ncbi:MAG: sulfatase-like hydrolase/transferase [Chitinophagaceae bacterium]|nr:sulfatase-like hydrolase/transferase [Chitinophagaceae bacterium]
MKKIVFSRLSLWMIRTGICLLVFMTIMRFVFFYRFHPLSAGISDYVASFLLGVRYDLRIICGIILFPFLIGQLYIEKKNGKLSTGSYIRIGITVLIMVFLLGFMKKGHILMSNLIAMVILFLLVLLWLFLSKDCNPFHNKISRKIFRWYLNIIMLAVVFFYALDFEHYDYLKQRLSASVVNYAEDVNISANMIWETYPVFWLIFFIVIGTVALLWWVNYSYARLARREPGTKQTSTIPTVGLVIIFALAIFGRLNQYPLRWSDAFALGNDFKANLALNPFQSFLSTLSFRNSGYDLNTVKKYHGLVSEYLGINNPDNKELNFDRQFIAPANAPKRNVVIVICESFSMYKSSMSGNPLNTTPYFNQMCENGVFYDHCFTPSYGTARGVWATITGIPDVEYPNTSSRNPSYVDQHTIINDYKGYDKYYFIGGSSSWANIRGLLTNNIAGLHLLEEENFKAKKENVWGISDKRLLLAANDTFKSLKKPFIAIVQTADNHRPYTIPDEDKGEFKIENFPPDTLQKYGFASNEELNAFRYTDFVFKTFIEAAKKESYFKNTLFVFVGDHGIPGNADSEYPHVWEKASLTIHHVPLLFYAPGFLKPERSSRVCSQVDLLPSASALAGISYQNSTMGINLFDSGKINTPLKNAVFLFDPTMDQIGIATDSLVYLNNLISNKQMFYSMLPDIKPNKAKEDSMRILTTAWYETAKYLLYHNKKKEAGEK